MLASLMTPIRVQEHFHQHGLYTENQSAYRKSHSVESALLCISDTVLASIDAEKGVIMVLLDLSAAFDTIEHSTLTAILHFGITDKAICWLKSYLTSRT